MDQKHNDLLKLMVSKFDNIMDRKVDIYIRQSIRLNSTVRVGMIILGLVGGSIFLLLYSLSSQVGHMKEGVQQMNSHFADVEHNMRQVNQILQHIDTRVALMGAFDRDMQQALKTTTSLHHGVESIHQSMGEVSQYMNQLQLHIQQVNQQLASMQASVSGVGVETYRISKPMKALP